MQDIHPEMNCFFMHAWQLNPAEIHGAQLRGLTSSQYDCAAADELIPIEITAAIGVMY